MVIMAQIILIVRGWNIFARIYLVNFLVIYTLKIAPELLLVQPMVVKH
jgi:hypothetical protein